MAVQLNPYNIPNMNLPLTITPIIPALKDLSVSTAAPSKPDQSPSQPDLTFHCMCCPAYFVNPYMLYQHMNSQHPQPSEAEGIDKIPSEDDDQDYSWVLEPVCEIVDMGGDGEDDDSDSDSDSDDYSSSSSSQSSSSSSSTVTASNSNSNTQDSISNEGHGCGEDNTRITTVSTNTVPPAIYEEIVGGESTSSLSIPSESAFPMFKFKTADPREYTSIILLNPCHTVQPLQSNTSITPVVIKPGRGRRSAAQNAQLAALANGDQKCFQCAHCEASFQNAGDLSKHVRCHITNKPFKCAICEKTFTHIGSLNTHIRIHSGEKPYKCEMCPKAFTQSSSLMVHVRSHSVRKPHQCHLCDKGFINSSSLVLHLKPHDETEVFNCPECDKSFKQEDLLEKHLQMHTQELVYQCSICHEAFRTSSELVQHMKCHMGEKPFTCSICDRSFTQSGSLGIHMRIHTGERPFQCKLCDKAFTQASSLSVHMKIHTGEKSYPCHICGKSYSQQAYLNKHIQAHLAAGQTDSTANAASNLPFPTGLMQSQETLVCIFCGVLHKDVNSLALHVTQKHAVLLNNSVRSAAAQMQMTSDNVSEEERRLQEQQYMQQLQLMLRSANGGALQHIAMDVDMGNGVVKVEVEEEETGSFEPDREYKESAQISELDIIKQEFDPESYEDYGAEEEVETEE
ncbi:zinc finger protein 260-like isoform X1 [Rhagoletis pomonella]|uniref:zinc finger protein 260-like isoform X1 n=1 Tax=Rhagoletis pomonella TaxID=28610 RepID=UPI001782E6DB|nr:zinc finger protein 260-like isoform X1 [Rhagoletis pomonella]